MFFTELLLKGYINKHCVFQKLTMIDVLSSCVSFFVGQDGLMQQNPFSTYDLKSAVKLQNREKH